MACHAVLWIPTIVYKGLSGKHGSVEKNISDIPGKDFFVKVSLSNGGDVLVETKDEMGNYVPFVSLECEAVSSNGLMSFTYESASNNEFGFRFTTTEFPTAIYHIIKSFYHKHEFHDGESDSSISPFVSSDKVEIREKDNEALLHYLKAYGNVISSFVGYIQMAIRLKRENKDKIEETRGLLNDMCLKARGYEVYLGVLYHSQYNTLCCPNNIANRELRHVACNIENGLRYIRVVEHEYGEYMQQAFVGKMIEDAGNSLRSSKWSIAIGWASVFLGIISLIVSIVISVHSTRELNSARNALQQEFDCIPSFLQKSETTDNKIVVSQEEISDTQHKLDERLRKIEYRLEKVLLDEKE